MAGGVIFIVPVGANVWFPYRQLWETRSQVWGVIGTLNVANGLNLVYTYSKDSLQADKGDEEPRRTEGVIDRRKHQLET